MSIRTGLGVLEVAVLDAVAAVGGTTEAEHRRSNTVLDVLDRDHGFGRRYAYPMLVDLAAPWRMHLPLLEGVGNWGTQRGDPAAGAQYTEVRLSPVGALALAAERGQLGPVPLELIEGSFHRDGPVPPFAPARVVEALMAGRPDAGPPVMPTGGMVDGNVDALLSGLPTTLILGSTITPEPGGLVITEVPYGVPIDDVVLQLPNRVATAGRRRYADYLPDDTDLDYGLFGPAPISDIRDESSGRDGTRIVCIVAPGAEVDRAQAWIRSVWPITIEVDCQLPGPMGQRLANWQRGDGSGLVALSAHIPGA